MAQDKNRRIKHFFFYDFVKITGIIPALLFFRPHVVYLNPHTKKELKGRILIIANHNSFLDPVLIMSSLIKRRVVFMATQELFASKFGNWFFRHVHCIPVNKENFSMGSFKQVSEELADNRVVALFPEGELDEEAEKVNVFKQGAVIIADRNNTPVLPVYISRKEKYHRRVAVFGELIDLNKVAEGTFGLAKINKCGEYLYNKELELVEYCKKINESGTKEF